MALIKCPECGNRVSDKVQSCIHCGFPLIAMTNTICNINGKPFDLSDYRNKLQSISSDERFELEHEFFNKVGNLTIYEVRELFDKILSTKLIPQSFISHHIPADTPRCPKCGSTAITTGARGVNWTHGLIGASKTVNRCSSCGHTWAPKK